MCASKNDFDYASKYTGYKYLSERRTFFLARTDKLKKLFNKVAQLLIGRNCFYFRKFTEKVDGIYPVISPWQIKSNSKKIYWIPDLQELFLPQYFSKKEIKSRCGKIKEIIKCSGHIVFSSQDALDSFNKYYPEGANLKRSVLHFASKIDATELNDEEYAKDVLDKYKIKTPFFYCPNQFWIHKNHKCLFKAISILKKDNIDIKVVCSGATEDYRNPDYYPSIEDFIEKNHLQENIKIVGFVSRAEQLVLLRSSCAIIQPSLFEGWNTSIEEAKSMNKYLILSDLNVHKEQVCSNVTFFARNNPDSLAYALREFIKTNPTIETIDYDSIVADVGKEFYRLMTEA